jgi:hypothetical protein
MTGAQAKKRSEDNLVEFDYDIWRRFGLKLYWPNVRGKTDKVWPMEVLKIRKHPKYQGVAIAKTDNVEEVVLFDINLGVDENAKSIYMDLDSLLEDPIDRSSTIWEEIICTIKIIWRSVRALTIMWWKYIKIRYEYRQSKFTS